MLIGDRFTSAPATAPGDLAAWLPAGGSALAASPSGSALCARRAGAATGATTAQHRVEESLVKIAPGEKFSCFAFSRCSAADDLPEELVLGPGVVARRDLGIAVGEHWPAWLGSLTMNELKAIGLTFFATAASSRPEVLDAENQALTRALDYIWYGLLLQGVPSHMEGFTMTGAYVDGEIQVRLFGHIRDYEPTYDMPEFVPDVAALQRAAALGEQLRRIDVPKAPDWGRLRRGLRSLFRGLREKDGGERLHAFVRALEALLKPDIGNTRNQFAHRAQTFARASAETRETLLQIFDIRSHVEHVHLAIDALSGSEPDRIALANRRTRQVDALVRSALTRVLETDVLLDVFRTDPTIDQFWAMTDAQRVAMWGPRVDITAIA